MWILAPAGVLVLGGLLAVAPDVRERWCPSGAWLFPVGDPYDFQLATPGAGAAYRLSRNVGDGHDHPGGHQGADLSCRGGGGIVRAAATGLVVKAASEGWQRGYGRHVVLAHRDDDGQLTYSIYAHLESGSLRARAGRVVHAGEPLGRVGMSGRATSPHLHFEVRRPERPDVRWEKARIVDPLDHVSARLPGQRRDTTWARPYLEWAELSALLADGEEGSGPLRRASWWRMLAAATTNSLPAIAVDPDSLRDALRASGVIDAREPERHSQAVTWAELTEDLRRAEKHGLRLGARAEAETSRRKDCARELGQPSASPLRTLGKRDRPPTVGQACLVLADLAGERAGAAHEAATGSEKH
ncbi:MAG TPA: M23 family metallopeptidase [Candidatus Limnocylindria bacterium]|nr:M23 family metallopeptidase [Candidatus Limnocylindria bacterium]